MAHFYAAGYGETHSDNLISTKMLDILRKLPDSYHILAGLRINDQSGTEICEIDWVIIPTNRMGGIVIIEEKLISCSVMLLKASVGKDWMVSGRYDKTFQEPRRNGVDQVNRAFQIFKEKLLSQSKLLFGCPSATKADLFIHKILFLNHQRTRAINIETTEHTKVFQSGKLLLEFLETCSMKPSLPTTEIQAINIAWMFNLNEKTTINGIDLQYPKVTFEVPREKAHLIAGLIAHFNE